MQNAGGALVGGASIARVGRHRGRARRREMRLRLDGAQLGHAARLALAEDAPVAVLVDALEERARVGDLHRRGARRHRGGRGEIREAPLAHAVLVVAVLRREPGLALARLLAGHAEAHRAARRTDAEAVFLVDLPEPRAPQVLLDVEIARHHQLLRLRRSGRGAGRLEHQRSQDQLFLRGGAGPDEETVERQSFDLGHAGHVVRRERPGHLRLELVERDGVARQIGRIVVGAEGLQRLQRQRVVRVGAAREPRRRHLVRLEDAVQAPELRGHVGDGEAGVGRELPDAGAAVLDRSLHRDRVAPEQRERLEDHFLAAQAEGQLALVLDRDRLGHLQPRGAQHHRHHDVGPAEPDGECAQPAVRRRVRVRAEHHVVGTHQVPVELGVQDGVVRVVEVADAALARERLRELHQLLRALVRRQRDRVHRVIDGEEEAVLVVQAGPAERRVGALHPVPRQLARDGPVHADLKHVPGLDPRPRQVARVGREDLLGQRHRLAVVHQGR